MPASVVAAAEPVRRRLLDLLVRGRLVTSADGGYDLAHEALVRAWPRLRDWLEEDRVGQQIRRHLAMPPRAGRPSTARTPSCTAAPGSPPPSTGSSAATSLCLVSEREFIAASRAVAGDQMQRLAEDARRQRRQNRRSRGLVAVAVILLVAAAAAGGVARDRGREAERGLDAATAAAADARHESIVARSLTLLSTSKRFAALMAVQAWSDRPPTCWPSPPWWPA